MQNILTRTTRNKIIQLREKKKSVSVGATSKKKKKGSSSSQPVPNPGAFDDYDTPKQTTIKSTPSPTQPQQSNDGFIKTSSGKKQQQQQQSSSKKDSINKKSTESTVNNNDQSQIIINTSTIEPAKRLRNLRKKLRDIENLEQKIKTKELKNPDKDQLEKVSRKGNVQTEILALELEMKMTV